jgi:hypothetical protein
MRDRCRGGGFVFRIGSALGLKNGGRWRGASPPRLSGDETRQAVEQHGEDRLIGGARRQVDLDLLFQFDDAGGEFQQAQPQGVELHDTPSGARRHQAAHRPQQPVGAGMQEQAELVGLGRVAGGSVGGEVVFPGLSQTLA